MNNLKTSDLKTNIMVRDYRHDLLMFAAYKESVLGQLSAHILSLPDNPEITRVGNGNSFTMSISSLGKSLSLSAESYDFKFQYGVIVEKIKSADDCLSALQKIVADGFIKTDNYGKVTLHETVVAYIKDIIA